MGMTRDIVSQGAFGCRFGVDSAQVGERTFFTSYV